VFAIVIFVSPVTKSDWFLFLVTYVTETKPVMGLSKNRRDDGTTTGQDIASLPQLAAISSP